MFIELRSYLPQIKKKWKGQQAIMASDIIKKEVVRGIFSSCYDNNTDAKHEEIFPPTTQNILSIEEGLDFIISHFEEPVWHRTIFTKH
jgi:hypothetical protein